MCSNPCAAEKFEFVWGSKLTGSTSAAAAKVPPLFGWPAAATAPNTSAGASIRTPVRLPPRPSPAARTFLRLIRLMLRPSLWLPRIRALPFHVSEIRSCPQPILFQRGASRLHPCSHFRGGAYVARRTVAASPVYRRGDANGTGEERT